MSKVGEYYLRSSQISEMENAFREQWTVLAIRKAEMVTDMELPKGSIQIQIGWDDFAELFAQEDYSEMDGPTQGSIVRFLWDGSVMYVADSRF